VKVWLHAILSSAVYGGKQIHVPAALSRGKSTRHALHRRMDKLHRCHYTQNCSRNTTHSHVCTVHAVRICSISRSHSTTFSGIARLAHVSFRLDPGSKLSPDISSNDLRFSFVLSFRLSDHMHVQFYNFSWSLQVLQTSDGGGGELH